MGTLCVWYLYSRNDTYNLNLWNLEPTNSQLILFFIKPCDLLVKHNVYKTSKMFLVILGS